MGVGHSITDDQLRTKLKTTTSILIVHRIEKEEDKRFYELLHQHITKANVYWTIPFYEESEILQASQQGDFVQSRMFTIKYLNKMGEDKDTYWRLRLYPRGELDAHMEVSLYVENLNPEVKGFSFSVQVLKNGGSLVKNAKGDAASMRLSQDWNTEGINLVEFEECLTALKLYKTSDHDPLYITLRIAIDVET